MRKLIMALSAVSLAIPAMTVSTSAADIITLAKT